MNDEEWRKQINKGFFTMEDVNKISVMTNIQEAKQYALSRVTAQPNAHLENINKATTVINKAKNINQLVLSISNFVLAHTSEGLSVIR